MDDAQRLALIAETVRYCQHVKLMDMPSRCYSKALREPIHFLWERRENRQKIQVPKFRSKSAVGLSFGKREVIYDHAIPFRGLQKELLQLDPVTPEAVFEILSKYETIVLITAEDERRLRRVGLSSKMPDGWDGKDALARYKAAEIEVIDNELYAACEYPANVTEPSPK